MSAILSRYIDHREVLPTLGVTLPHDNLPVSATCPLCSHFGLQVHWDLAAHDGQWCYCTECGFYGDLFLLFCRATEQEPAEAWANLRKLGLTTNSVNNGLINDDIEVLGQLYPSWIRLYENLDKWREIGRRQWLKAIDDLKEVRQHLYLDPDKYSTQTWSQLFGRIFLTLETKELSKLILDRHSPRYANNAGNRIDSDGVIAAPVWTLPHRMIGVNVFFYSKYRRRVVGDYYAISPWHMSKIDGVTGLNVLWDFPDLDASESLVLLAPPVEALRLQARHMHLTGKPAKLAGLSEVPLGGYPDVLQYLPEQNVLIWSPKKLRPRTIWRAALNDVAVSDYSSPTYDKDHPATLLNRAREHAVDWRDAFRNMLTARSPSSILKELQLDAVQLEEFLALCPQDLEEAFARSGRDKRRFIRLSLNRLIIDNGKEWRCSRTGALILDGRLTIDRLYAIPSGKDLLASCRLERKGKVYQRLLPWSTVRGKSDDWLYKLLLESGAITSLDRLVERTLIRRAAFAASRPRLTNLPGYSGWHPDKGALIFPRFAIFPGGRVVTYPAERIWGDALPYLLGHTLRPPMTLNPVLIEELARPSNASVIFWACLAAGLRIILSPIQQKDSFPLCLPFRGDVEDILLNCAASLFELPLHVVKPEWARIVREYGAKSNWPLVSVPTAFSEGGRKARQRGRAISGGHRNIEAAIDYLLGSAGNYDPLLRQIGISRAHSVMHYGVGVGNSLAYTGLATIRTPKIIKQYGSTVLSAYLVDLASRKYNISVTARDILHDLKSWFERTTKLDVDEVFRRSDIILWDGETDDLPTRFLRLLIGILRWSSFIPKIFFYRNLRKTEHNLRVDPFVKRNGILEVLGSTPYLYFDADKWERSLIEAGLIELDRYSGHDVWKLDLDFTDRLIRTILSYLSPYKKDLIVNLAGPRDYATEHTEMPQLDVL